MANPVEHLNDYELRHLVAHLERAGRTDDLHRLLALETDDGHNAWQEARSRRGDLSGYLTDVSLAWRSAERLTAHQSGKDSPTVDVGSHVRYALITATFTSHARNIPADLLVAATERGVWSHSEVITLAHQVPDVKQRVRSLLTIALRLPEPSRDDVLHEALELVRSAEVNEHDKLRTLLAFATQFAGSQRSQMVEEALELTRVAKWSGLDKANVLQELAEHFPTSQQAQMLGEALELVRGAEGSASKSKAFQELAAQFSGFLRAQVLEEARVAAWAEQDRGERASALASLVPLLPEALRSQMVQEAMSELREAGRMNGNAAPSILAPYLSEPLLQEALTIVQKFRHQEARFTALSSLAPYLSVALLDRALTESRTIKSRQERARTLAVLACQLSEPLKSQILEEALQVAKTVRIDGGRPAALAAVAGFWSQASRDQVIAQALAAMRPERYESDWGEVLIALLPHLSEPLLQEAWEKVRAINLAAGKVEMISTLLPHLPSRLKGPALHSALAAARTIDVPQDRIKALAALAPQLSPSARERILDEALQLAQTVQQWSHRGDVLMHIAPLLSTTQLRRAIDVSRAISDDIVRNLTLLDLASGLSQPPEDDIIEQLFSYALGKSFYEGPPSFITPLIPHLTDALFRKALSVTRRNQPGKPDALPEKRWNEPWKVSFFAALAPYLPESLLPEGLAVARSFGYKDDRIQALVALGPYVSGQLLQEALDEAWCLAGLQDHDLEYLYYRDDRARYYRVDAVVGLARSLPQTDQGPVLKRAWEVARTMREALPRARNLAVLVPSLPRAWRYQALQEVVIALRGMTAGENWKVLLHHWEPFAALAPYWPESLHRKALEVVLTIQSASERAAALARLALYVSNPLQNEVLYEALEVTRAVPFHDERTRALAGVVSHLSPSLISEIGDEVLVMAKAMLDRVEAIQPLTKVAVSLPEPARSELLRAVLERAGSMEFWLDRVCEMRDSGSHLVLSLPEPMRDKVLREVLAAVRRVVRGDGLGRCTNRLLNLAQLIPYVPATEQADVIHEILGAAYRLRGTALYSSDNASLYLSLKIPPPGDVPRSQLHTLWSATLHGLASERRSTVLERIRYLIPSIAALGGQNALVQVREAIGQVTRWWP